MTNGNARRHEMTELAQIAPEQTPEAQHSIVHDYLKLSRTMPFTTYYTVYARAVDPDTDGISRVAFALEQNATEWHTRGVKWKFRPDEVEYGLFLCFVLVEGIEELALPKQPVASPFWFSTTWIPSSTPLVNQMCCTPLVPDKKTRYHFRAKLTSGSYVDPKIIVSPINNTGEDDDEDDADDRDRLSLTALDGGRASTGRSALEDLLVPLPVGGAFTVNVKISNDGPLFSVPPSPTNPNPPQLPGGVTWTASKGFPGVSLTFQFPTVQIFKLESTTAGLTFSQGVIVGSNTQQSCQLTATAVSVTYCFDVVTPSGQIVRGVFDPKIIINPINNL
jgi:hypothetical protein